MFGNFDPEAAEPGPKVSHPSYLRTTQITVV